MRRWILALALIAGCGGATPRVIAYDGLWRACQEVKEEIHKSPQQQDERWLQIQQVDYVCSRLGKKVLDQ